MQRPRQKRKVFPVKHFQCARINTRQIDAPKRKSMAEKANSVSKTASGQNSGKKYKEGSMAAKANKVREYNEKNSK